MGSDEQTLSPIERFEVLLALVALAGLLVAVPFGLLLVQVQSEGPFTDLDLDVASFFNRTLPDIPGGVGLMKTISFFGSTAWLTPFVTAIAIAMLVNRHRRITLFLAVTCIGGALVNIAMKQAVERARPIFDAPIAHADGLSFPSGHAMSSTVCYGALCFVLVRLVPPSRRRAVVAVTVTWVALIGFTRIAIGVHYLSDVIAGFALGGAWLLCAIGAFGVYREELRPARIYEETGSGRSVSMP